MFPQALWPPLGLDKLQIIPQQNLGRRYLDLRRRDVPARTRRTGHG